MDTQPEDESALLGSKTTATDGRTGQQQQKQALRIHQRIHNASLYDSIVDLKKRPNTSVEHFVFQKRGQSRERPVAYSMAETMDIL